MAGLLRLLWRPRATLLWRSSFQIHLWLGLLLALYLLVMAVSGSILVLRVELSRISRSKAVLDHNVAPPSITVPLVVQQVRATFPGRRLLAVDMPTQDEPCFVALLQGHGPRLAVRVDARSGRVLGVIRRQRDWLDFLTDLHTTLFLGRAGRIMNGVGGALLLVMAGSGMVLWWPGIKSWKRGLAIDFRRTWRRVTYDAHRAIGFWAFTAIAIWALSGIYFGWPDQIRDGVNAISPLITALPPRVHVPQTTSGPAPTLAGLLQTALRVDAGTFIASVQFPYSRQAPYEILLHRGAGIGREYSDTVYLSPLDGSHLATWRYGKNESLGDWVLWLQAPLHFGTYWGLGFKLLWAILGLSIALLVITGMLMYWNRVLRKLWGQQQAVEENPFVGR